MSVPDGQNFAKSKPENCHHSNTVCDIMMFGDKINQCKMFLSSCVYPSHGDGRT